MLRFVKRPGSERLRTANTLPHDTGGRGKRAASTLTTTSDLFGRYGYVSQVGIGGGGSVHLVRDSQLLREVALKVLDPAHVSKPRQAHRFLHEAQITAQLDHPNIVPVYDLGGSPASYYTMKMVLGTTFADWIAASSGPGRSRGVLFDMIAALIKVCDALAFAHSRGVLHCDLKPSNIMVGDFGEVYLMDWGTAQMVSRTKVKLSGIPVPGRPGRMIGTPAFMAPEQLRGRYDQLDERTDVFGLGGVLYSILTGRAPFDADSMEQTLAKARTGKVRLSGRDPLREPPALCRIVEKAMARRPKDRYGSVLEMKRDLEIFVKGGYQLPTRVYAANTPIIIERERGDEVFIIEKGTCRVSKAIGGTERVLREMGPGGVFGETAALAGGVRTATVTAVDEVTVRVVSKKILDEYLGPDTWIGALVVALAQRFRAADERIAQLESQTE
jgi:serine/threonine-protein kinase